MPKATKNPRKKALQDLLAQNGRRLDWVVAQFKISRTHFDRKLKDGTLDMKKATDLIINGIKSKHCTVSYEPRPRNNR